MSIRVRRAAAVLLVLAAFVIYRVGLVTVLARRSMRGVARTGSGGPGAVSVGLNEGLVELVAIAILVGAIVYWRSRRPRSLRSARRR